MLEKLWKHKLAKKVVTSLNAKAALKEKDSPKQIEKEVENQSITASKHKKAEKNTKKQV